MYEVAIFSVVAAPTTTSSLEYRHTGFPHYTPTLRSAGEGLVLPALHFIFLISHY